MASSLQTLERRILALEARLADVEGGFGATMYRLHRNSVETRLNFTKVLAHLQITGATEEEIDAALDAE